MWEEKVILKNLKAILTRLKIKLTAEQSQQIMAHPNKQALCCALWLLNCFKLSAEITPVYLNNMLLAQANHLSPDADKKISKVLITDELYACLMNESLHDFLITITQLSANDNPMLIATLELFAVLLRQEELSLHDIVSLLRQILTHNARDTLYDSFLVLSKSSTVKLFSANTPLFLKAVLNDQETPLDTASLLMLLMENEGSPSKELIEKYCDEIAYRKEIYINYAIVGLFELRHDWSIKRAKTCMQAIVLNDELVEPNADALEVLNITKQLNSIIRDVIYQNLCNQFRLLKNKHSFTECLNRLSCPDVEILMQKAIKLSGLLSESTSLSLADSFTIINIIGPTIQYDISDRLQKQLSENPYGASFYSNYMLRASNQFFNSSPRAALEDNGEQLVRGATI